MIFRLYLMGILLLGCKVVGGPTSDVSSGGALLPIVKGTEPCEAKLERLIKSRGTPEGVRAEIILINTSAKYLAHAAILAAYEFYVETGGTNGGKRISCFEVFEQVSAQELKTALNKKGGAFELVHTSETGEKTVRKINLKKFAGSQLSQSVDAYIKNNPQAVREAKRVFFEAALGELAAKNVQSASGFGYPLPEELRAFETSVITIEALRQNFPNDPYLRAAEISLKTGMVGVAALTASEVYAVRDQVMNLVAEEIRTPTSDPRARAEIFNSAAEFELTLNARRARLLGGTTQEVDFTSQMQNPETRAHYEAIRAESAVAYTIAADLHGDPIGHGRLQSKTEVRTANGESFRRFFELTKRFNQNKIALDRQVDTVVSEFVDASRYLDKVEVKTRATNRGRVKRALRRMFTELRR